jgi:hypothetical protein
VRTDSSDCENDQPTGGRRGVAPAARGTTTLVMGGPTWCDELDATPSSPGQAGLRADAPSVSAAPREGFLRWLWMAGTVIGFQTLFKARELQAERRA